MFYIEMAM